MKPESLTSVVNRLKHDVSQEADKRMLSELQRQQIEQPMIDSQRRRIADALERASAYDLADSQLVTATEADAIAKAEKQRLCRLGARYAEALLELCGNATSTGNEASTHDITISRAEFEGVGTGYMRARLTAYAYRDQNPLQGARIKGFEMVVALCEDETTPLPNFDLQHYGSTPDIEVPPYLKNNAPAGAVVIIDQQCLCRNHSGDIVMTEDFTAWAREMLVKAENPANAPAAYAPSAIDSIASREVGSFSL